MGVALTGVVTYVSKLYPGSISDKAIVQQSGFLNHLTAGDMVLADKGFVIQDRVRNGVSVNIPLFLNNGTFTESEARATKAIAKCRIGVERANTRLKDFNISSFIPSYLCCPADIIFQLCASLVNLQFPLIEQGVKDMNLINELNICYGRTIKYFVKYMLICLHLFPQKGNKSAFIVEFTDVCKISAQQQLTTIEQYSSNLTP